MLSYYMGWLRYYYPTEYCTSFLNCAKNDEDIINGTNLAVKKGCTIKTPLFRYSTSEYGCDTLTKTIYKGIASIKDVGKDTGNKLYKLKDNKYNTFYDLLNDIKIFKIANQKEITILIKIGYFDEFGNKNLLLKMKDLFFKKFDKSTIKKTETDNLYLTSVIAEKETEKQFSKVDMLKTFNANIDNIPFKESTIFDDIAYEIKYLQHTDKTFDCPYCAIKSVEQNKYGSWYANIYSIKTGKTINCKITKAWYNEYPCTTGDILECIFKRQHKKRIVNHKWVELDESEIILDVYSKILSVD